MKPKTMAAFYGKIEKIFRDKGFIAGNSGRHMKFPYTFSAKIAQFPIFYYLKHNNIWMYYPCGLVLTFYCFWKINAVVNSDANKRNWAEQQAKAHAKEHGH